MHVHITGCVGVNNKHVKTEVVMYRKYVTRTGYKKHEKNIALHTHIFNWLVFLLSSVSDGISDHD